MTAMTAMREVLVTIVFEAEPMETIATVFPILMTIDDLNEFPPIIAIQAVAKIIEEEIDRMANRIGDPEIGIVMVAVDGTMEGTAIILRLERAADIDIKDNWIVCWFEQAFVH